MEAYKEAKEAFVSQLQGGSIFQINAVSLTALTTYSLWACLRNRRVLFDARHHQSTSIGTGSRSWWAEVLVLVVPIVLAVTVLASHLISLNAALMAAGALVLHLYPAPSVERQDKKAHKRHWSKRDSDDDESEGERRRPRGVLQNSEAANDPMRISVDSAADAALASAAPPTAFVPPGLDGSNYSHSSSRPSSESGHDSRARSPPAIISSSPLRQSSTRFADPFALGSPASISRRLTIEPKASKGARAKTFLPRNQPFLSVYRAHMMLMTIICILAVDFPVFPREFAKCETWGTSLMDMGVGSFVFSMGIVSALPLLRSPSQRFKPLRAQLLRDVRRSVPLILLGAVRVFMVKGVEYPEHISEYGVHWNFFITLALLPFFGTLCRPLTRWTRHSLLALLFTSCHQLLLSFTHLGSWTTSNAVLRTTFVAQNKEGIVSFPGYLSLFFLGIDLGHYVLPRDPYLAYRRPSKSRGQEKTDKLAMVLASFSILWWAAYYVDTLVMGDRVSRRLANLPYVLWVTAYNTTFLLCYVVIYMVLLQPLRAGKEARRGNDGYPVGSEYDNEAGDEDDSKTPLLLTSLNHAAFPVFLIANLLTGLINISIHTMYSPHFLALTILILYSCLCLALATQAHLHGWKLPF